MRSENDLRAAIDELAAEALPQDQIVNEFLATADRGQHAQRRRRRLLPIAAALVVAAVAGLLVTVTWGVIGRHRDDIPTMTNQRSCTTSATPRFDTFAIDPVPGFGMSTVQATTCAGYRSRWLYTSTGALAGAVTLYSPGVFDESLLTGATRVSGHGITGFTRDLPGSVADPVCTVSCTTLRTLVWGYQPGAWAVLALQGPNQMAKQLAIAAAVRPDQRRPLRSPFQLSSLPTNVRAVSAASGLLSDPAKPVGWGTATVVELGQVGGGAGCRTPQVCQVAASINVSSSVSTELGGGLTGRHVTINGHPAVFVTVAGQQGRLAMVVGHWFVNIMRSIAATSITDADLAAIATAMTFAPSYTDTSTWFTVDDALPH